MAECGCPRLDEKKFQNKFFNWKGKVFYTAKQPLFFHVPIKIDKRIKRLMMDVESSGYNLKDPEIVIQEDAAFKGRIMIEIQDPKVEHENLLKFKDDTKIYSTVFTEPWSRLHRGVRSAVKELHKKGMGVKKVYFMYLTCPVCAEERGYKTVILCKVKKKKVKPKKEAEKKPKEEKKETKQEAKAEEKPKEEKGKGAEEKNRKKEQKKREKERKKRKKETEKKQKQEKKAREKAEKEKQKQERKRKKELEKKQKQEEKAKKKAEKEKLKQERKRKKELEKKRKKQEKEKKKRLKKPKKKRKKKK
ncbi:hypothetical protein KY345_05005 [Candidatus Woesearchaeota archaeon]|nr:hypothetical protein [Candidatus Woesearchaeota archaeon]